MAIEKKENIITYLYSDIKPILAPTNETYNNILMYSYFHNDVIVDMKKLGFIYHDMYPNYIELFEYWKITYDYLNDLQELVNNYNEANPVQPFNLPPNIPIIGTKFNDGPEDTRFTIENYTYTWKKGQSYHMPYYDESEEDQIISTELTYMPNIQDYGTTILFSYLKFCNNRYENHMPAIM